MKNDKLENQENLNNKIEDVSGGKAMIHVDTTDKENPAKMDYIYLSLRDFWNLVLVEAIDMDKTPRIDISKQLSRSDGQRLLNNIISKAKLTTRKRKPWEVKLELYDSGSKDK